MLTPIAADTLYSRNGAIEKHFECTVRGPDHLPFTILKAKYFMHALNVQFIPRFDILGCVWFDDLMQIFWNNEMREPAQQTSLCP